MKNKRHNYEYDVDTDSESAPANVIHLVGQNKRVLEIGCGPGSITKILATKRQCSVTGLELDVEAIKKVRPFCENIFQADLNSKDWPTLLDGLGQFDVVVAADVLEHLYDPWVTLQKMVPLVKQNGYIVISLPHVGHAAVMSCLFNGDFQYVNHGLLDRTHIRFFCLKNIEDLFYQAKLKIIEVVYVTKPSEETEFAAGWAKLPSFVKHALNSAPHSDIYQVVVKAVPLSFDGKALRLSPIHHIRKKVSFLTAMKRRIVARMSPELKRQVRSVLKLTGIKV